MDFKAIQQVVRPFLSEIDRHSSSTDVWVACSRAAHAFSFADLGTMALVYAACYQLLELRGKAVPDSLDYLFFNKIAGAWYGEVSEGEGSGLREGGSQVAFPDYGGGVRPQSVGDEGWGEWRRSPSGLQQEGQERTFGIRGRGEKTGEDEP